MRSPREILATLDERGRLDGVPFMPEMLVHFRAGFIVDAQVERACDTVNYSGVLAIAQHGHPRRPAVRRQRARRLRGAVPALLEEGLASARVRGGPDEPESLTDDLDGSECRRREHVTAQTRLRGPRFACQATELIRAGEPVGWYDTGSFLRELTGGNVGPGGDRRVMASFVLPRVGLRSASRRVATALSHRDS